MKPLRDSLKLAKSNKYAEKFLAESTANILKGFSKLEIRASLASAVEWSKKKFSPMLKP